MPKTKKKFVFNDENLKNSYGFHILTNGIGLSRFLKNPVMLDSHRNSNESAIGQWENVKVEKGLLTGEPVFDNDDEKAAFIGGKVERGIIKSCSMGVSFNRDDLKFVEGKLILTKCELMEVSIVAVPSNANAIRLYASDTNEELTQEQVQTLCLSITPEAPEPTTPKNKNVDMKIKLTAAAAAYLALSAGAEIDAADLQTKLCEVAAERDAAKLQLDSIKEAEEQAKLAAIQTKVDKAIKAGQITADKKDKFVQLGVVNPELLDTTLAAIPLKRSLSGTITPTGSKDQDGVKTKEDFQKLSVEEQLQFKTTNPEQYIKLFTN